MNVLRNLDPERIRMDFVKHTEAPCAYEDELERLGSNIYFCGPASNPFLYAQSFNRILRAHGSYDVVHSHVHYFSGLIVLLARFASIPVRIVHSHTADMDGKASFARAGYQGLAAGLIDVFASHKLAVSERAARCLFGKKWRTDSRTGLMYLGIDLRSFERPVDRTRIRSELGFGPGDFVLGHVGRFVAEKNHRFLLRIHAEVLKTRPESRLLLIGQGPLEAECREEARALGTAQSVHFTGERPDIGILLQAMDVFVFPSLFEGLGLAAVEAQAAGLPTIVSGNVPWEVDAGCGLVTRIPVDASAQDWAIQVLQGHNARTSSAAAIAAIRQSRFSLDGNLSHLGGLYAASVSLSGTSPGARPSACSYRVSRDLR